MSRKQQQEIEKQLIEIVNSSKNENKCGECGSSYPTWASYNLGIFLCGRCASVHKKILGPPNNNISKVKSLTLDKWNHEQLDHLRRVGNKKAKKRWNPKRVPFPYDGADDVAAVEQYIRDKYVIGKFRDDNIEAADYEEGRGSRYSDESDSASRVSIRNGRSRANSRATSNLTPGGGRSRSGSKNFEIPRLSHRKLTTFENTQYSQQLHKILNYGYTNRDSVLESLLLSGGEIELALDILDQDSKLNPNQDEIPPELPRRRPGAPPTTSLIDTAPTTSASTQQVQPSEEWWSTNSGAAQSQVTGIAQPQIYQYTDPITGQVSYVDANGQQYLDPTNPQHQQQLLQQSNPQLIAQQTNKQNILSLYNQPNSFTTPVAVPVSQQHAQQAQTQQVQPTQQAQVQAQQQYIQQPQQIVQQTGYMQQQPTFVQQQQPQQNQQFAPQFTGFGQPQQQSYNPYNQTQQQNQFNWR
ncbi:hypothetical protein G9P44_005563 [Scheffersomyces stipitis]|nr:hypothetical protein G9P44_005563 [Scheffersomyces stipitis]